MQRLNAHQIRHVLATFTHVDALLRDVERFVRDDPPPPPSPFAWERADLAPDEARLLASFVSQARSRMLAALDSLGIPRPQATLSARWSVSTSLTFGEIALSEISESTLRGYGTIDAAVASELAALVRDLRDLLMRGKGLLHEHDAGGLHELLAALPGPAGDVLRFVERVSTSHALAGVRPLIAAAAERVASATFDVGIFGRVSAGKSSLINALIDAPLLPVGATPVTAVPIRITNGPSGAIVRMLDGTSLTITIAQIADYATETQNPHNKKGVRAIEASASGVPVGLRFLDTPGVGSLTSSGSAQAFAWLPRCDLGLVLIASGTAVGRDDLALVAGLGNAGIAWRVLLSKADVLDGDQMAQSVAYIHRELTNVLGPDQAIDVRPVSVVPSRAAQLDAVRRDVLAPLAADHSRAAREALRLRLHRLVADVDAALHEHDAGAPVALDAYTTIAAAAQAIESETDRLAASGPQVIRHASADAAAAWARNDDARSAARASFLNAASRSLAAVRNAIERAQHAIGAVPAGEGHRLPPLFDPEFLDALPALARPAIGPSLLGLCIARRRLAPIGVALDAALTRYAARVYAWGVGQLEQSTERGSDAPPAAAPTLIEEPDLAMLDVLIDQV